MEKPKNKRNENTTKSNSSEMANQFEVGRTIVVIPLKLGCLLPDSLVDTNLNIDWRTAK